MSVVVVLAVVVVAAVAAIAVAVALPWRVSLALSARGAGDGGWALAGGAQLSAVAATYTRGRGVPGAVGVHVLGRRVWPRRGAADRAKASAEESAEGAEQAEKKERAARRAGKLRWPRWIDPIDLALFVAGERRRLALRELDGRVRLALADVALAGQLSGLLAIASGLCAPFGRLHHEVDWAGEEALEASVSAQLRFSPALIVWDTALFFMRARREHRRRARAGERQLSETQLSEKSSSEMTSSERT